MNVIAVMVVKNEEFYIDMAIDSIIDHVTGIFILDTGSTDGTVSIVESVQKSHPSKIVIDQKDFGGNASTRFGKGYQELQARNYALCKLKETWDAEWIFAMDGDEVFNDKYWQRLGELGVADTVSHGTEMLVTPSRISNVPMYFTEWFNVRLFDPHCRFWNNKRLPNTAWVHQQDRHVILSCDGKTLPCGTCQVISEPVHFHLHHSFGPKAYYMWLSGEYEEISNMETSGIALNNLEWVFGSGAAIDAYYREKCKNNFGSDGRFVPNGNVLRDRMTHSRDLPVGCEAPKKVADKWNRWWNIEEFSDIH